MGFSFFFFFQAEDGIRDLVRSRGLGDVYKRQGQAISLVDFARPDLQRFPKFAQAMAAAQVVDLGPVSYTHLTLPTSDLV